MMNCGSMCPVCRECDAEWGRFLTVDPRLLAGSAGLRWHLRSRDALRNHPRSEAG